MKSRWLCWALGALLAGNTLMAGAETLDRLQELKDKKEAVKARVNPARTWSSENEGAGSIWPASGVSAMDTRNVILFFPRDGKQNPQGDVPNWYYYWIEGNVVSRLSDFNYDGSDGAFGYYDPNTKKLYVGNAACTTDQTYNVSHKYESDTATFPGGKGIDLCAMTVVHELKHKSLAETLPNYNTTGSPNAVDTDGDGLPDLYEMSLPYNLYITESDTYNLASIDPSYAAYGDEEFLCRKAEANPHPVTHSADWSDTNGFNWSRAVSLGQTVAVLGGAAEANEPLNPDEPLEALLEMLPTADARRQVAIIDLLGERAEAGGLDALIRLYQRQPLRIGLDSRPIVKLAIIRAASLIGGRGAKQFLMGVVDAYWSQGPRCECPRCGDAGLYPHHDGDYARGFAAALTALRPWGGDADVSFVFEKVSEDMDGVRSGPIRAVAWRGRLEQTLAEDPDCKGEEKRLGRVINEWATIGVCEPAERYVLENNVGKMTWKGIRNMALESMIREMDDVRLEGLEAELQSGVSPTPARQAVLRKAAEVLKHQRALRQANPSVNAPPTSP